MFIRNELWMGKPSRKNCGKLREWVWRWSVVHGNNSLWD